MYYIQKILDKERDHKDKDKIDLEAIRDQMIAQKKDNLFDAEP